MKKFVMIALCFMLAAVLILPVLATEPKVVLASGARFTAGSTLTVDIQKMTDMDDRIYNAWLEGTVQYQWYSGSNPIPGATGVRYTIQSSDKSVKVQVTCGDLVLTSVSYMVTNVGIVVTTKAPTTKAPTTKAPTTKAPTTKATTTAAPTTATPTQDPGVMPIEEPAVISTMQLTTVPDTVPTPVPTTVPTAAPTTQSPTVSQQENDIGTPTEEFPWWTLALAAAVAVAIIGLALIAIRKKKSVE